MLVLLLNVGLSIVVGALLAVTVLLVLRLGDGDNGDDRREPIRLSRGPRPTGPSRSPDGTLGRRRLAERRLRQHAGPRRGPGIAHGRRSARRALWERRAAAESGRVARASSAELGQELRPDLDVDRPSSVGVAGVTCD